MKIPRDLDASELIKAPNHSLLKVGTLNAILTEVANHLGILKEEIL